MTSERPRDLRRRAAALAAGMLLSACAASPDPAGRWQGTADIPGAPLPLVVDVALDTGRQWVGSVVLPGRNVKGAPLKDLQVSERGLHFDMAPAFRGGAAGAVVDTRFDWRADGSLVGELRQGGLVAPLVLRRTGAAQVDLPVPGTPISPLLQGTWRGRYELDGVPREVTLTLANAAGGGMATGELVIVGKRTTTLAIDHVRQGSEFIVLKASAADFRIEGRWSTGDGTIRGRMAQGPFDAPLVLRKVEPAAGARS